MNRGQATSAVPATPAAIASVLCTVEDDILAELAIDFTWKGWPQPRSDCKNIGGWLSVSCDDQT